MSVVFYSRCKPQEADAIDLVLKYRKIFIGYPLANPGAVYDPHNLHTCVVRPDACEPIWNKAREHSGRKKQFRQNRNLVQKIDADKETIALVPRPSKGIIYCGRVVGGFQLFDDPPWYDEYIAMRSSLGAYVNEPSCWHGADVAQCWDVATFEPVPLPRIPAWIRRSLFGRSTYGIIHPDKDLGLDPYIELDSILSSKAKLELDWTHKIDDVEHRLLDQLTPSTFEHLVVSLMQLENEADIWSHVGGSGDGGLDGVGARSDGTVSALLQCKWQYWGGNPFPEQSLWALGPAEAKRYIASLRYDENIQIPEGIIFLDRTKIAQLIIRHSARLPQAISMRIGNPPT